MARLVVAAAVGIVVGVVTENPYLGFQAFALTYGVTGFLDPNSKQFGPRLNDLRAPQASYGTPIAYVEGAPRLAGCYIWATDKREISTTQSQGKGGPGVDSTTFTYEMDVLVELAINPCVGISDVWSNGELVWSNADTADAETLRASALTNSWRDIRFYGGGDDQLPDPTYEAAVGIGNAPAYRGRATVLIEGLNLGSSGQLPVLTFRVLSEGSAAVNVAELVRVPNDTHQARGVPAMSLGGFDLLKGVWDGTYFSTYEVHRIESDGSDTLTGIFSTPGINPYRTQCGNSDVSCLLISGIGSPEYQFVQCCYADGSHTIYNFSTFVNAPDTMPFSRVGDDVVFGCHSTIASGSSFAQKFAHFNSVTGALLGVSAAMAHPIYSVAISGTYVYGLSGGVGTLELYKLDLATLTLLSTFAPPSQGMVGASLVGTADGQLFLVTPTDSLNALQGGAAYEWNGSWTVLIEGIGAAAADTIQSDSQSYDNGTFLAQSFYDGGVLGDPAVVVSYAGRQIAATLPTLDQVVRRLCLRTGQLTDSDIDVTELEDDIVRAMAISQVSSTRATLEMLMGAYLFECVEGEVLRFVKRGGAPALTIPYADMGASADGTAEPLPKKRLNDVEIPARVSVKFANTLNDFQDGLESGERLITESTAVSVIELPLGFEPAEAKKLADANTMDLAVSLLQIGPIALTRKYAALEPTDVIEVVALDGSTFRTRIIKMTVGGGIYTPELVLDDATVVHSETATDSDYNASTLVRLLSNTDLELLDSPIFRDADNAPGFYVAAKPTGGKWPGFELDKSSDDVSYAKVLDSSARAVMGHASSTLGDFTGGWVFDEVNTLTVDVGEGELSSSTRDALLTSDVNALFVGTEVIQFRTASLLSPGVYLLSGFLRGRRGTEWAMAGHEANERVVLLETTTLRRVVDQASDLDRPYYWKAVTFGKSRASTPSEMFTDTGVGLKPFAPVDLRMANIGGELTLTWHRRTRLATRIFATAGVPLGEASESYKVDVVDTVSGATLRSAVVTSPSYTYSVAQQSTDGVTSASAVHFRVAQQSSTAGDGYPALFAIDSTLTPQAEIATVTVGGIFASGLVLYVKLGATTVNYTTLVGDATLSGIATSLAAAIDALSGYTATAVGPVITITGALSTQFTIQAGLPGGGQLARGAFQEAAAASVGSPKKFILSLILTAGIDGGSVFKVIFERGPPGFGDRQIQYSWTAVPNQSAGSILGSIPTAPPLITGFAGGSVTWFGSSFENVEADTPVGETQWTATASTTQPGALFRADVHDPGSKMYAVDQAQFVDFAIEGSGIGTPVVGNVYRITLGGVNFDYTVTGGNTFANVINGLVTAITGATYTATNNTPYPDAWASIRIAANVANVPFTYSTAIIPGSVSLTAVITQPAI